MCPKSITAMSHTSMGSIPAARSTSTRHQTWLPLHDHFWANVQDVLPSRAEATGNGLAIGTKRARLRMRDAVGTDMTMRVRLHSRGGAIMQIVAGPARLEGTDYDEFAIESYSSDP